MLDCVVIHHPRREEFKTMEDDDKQEPDGDTKEKWKRHGARDKTIKDRNELKTWSLADRPSKECMIYTVNG